MVISARGRPRGLPQPSHTDTPAKLQFRKLFSQAEFQTDTHEPLDIHKQLSVSTHYPANVAISS
jgi:hypothetical protein